MIKRRYFYSGKVHKGERGTYSPFMGCIETVSWRPDISWVIDIIMKKNSGSDEINGKWNVHIEYLARV